MPKMVAMSVALASARFYLARFQAGRASSSSTIDTGLTIMGRNLSCPIPSLIVAEVFNIEWLPGRGIV